MQENLLLRTWQLVAINEEAQVAATARAAVTLRLAAADPEADADGLAVSGSSGCNRYFGRCIVDGDHLHFGALGSTRMACPPPQMELEQRYLAALQGVLRWRVTDDELLLAGAGGALHFIAVSNDSV